MLHYISDLLKDSTDFLWTSVKAAHAVLLWKVDRGTVTWLDTEGIDRLSQTHAQKYTNRAKQNWGM